jgi:hypothetical protein
MSESYLKTSFGAMRLLCLATRILCASGLAANALSFTSSHCEIDSRSMLFEGRDKNRGGDESINIDVDIGR